MRKGDIWPVVQTTLSKKYDGGRRGRRGRRGRILIDKGGEGENIFPEFSLVSERVVWYKVGYGYFR